MKHVTMRVNLEIKFEMDDKRTDYDQAMQTALALAVEPNYHTIEEGVHLLYVEKLDPHFFFQTLNHPKSKLV